MASLLLNAAPIDYQNNINIDNNYHQNNFSKKERKNKTAKKDNDKKLKAEMLKNSIELSDDDDDTDSEMNLQNFKPVQDQNLKSNNPLNTPQQYVNNSQEYVNNSKQYVSDYYNNYMKNIQNSSNFESISNNELLKKLDNILYLLEDQNDEKNLYVTEELILYVFLGIFIIYVLDSFVRVGKYTR